LDLLYSYGKAAQLATQARQQEPAVWVQSPSRAQPEFELLETVQAARLMDVARGARLRDLSSSGNNDEWQTERALQRTAAEGLAKLLLADLLSTGTGIGTGSSGRSVRRDVLLQLSIVYFEPSSREEPQLRQMLGSFLKVYAYSSGEHQRELSHVFLPLLRHVLYAPPSGEEWPSVTNVAKVMLDLLSPPMGSPAQRQLAEAELASRRAPEADGAALSSGDIQGRLLVDLCKEALSDPDSEAVREYGRVLTMLDLTQVRLGYLATARALLDRILPLVADRLAKKSLEKIREQIAPKTDDQPLSQAEEHQLASEMAAVVVHDGSKPPPPAVARRKGRNTHGHGSVGSGGRRARLVGESSDEDVTWNIQLQRKRSRHPRNDSDEEQDEDDDDDDDDDDDA
jgi:hypothetical protein